MARLTGHRGLLAVSLLLSVCPGPHWFQSRRLALVPPRCRSAHVLSLGPLLLFPGRLRLSLLPSLSGQTCALGSSLVSGAAAQGKPVWGRGFLMVASGPPHLDTSHSALLTWVPLTALESALD